MNKMLIPLVTVLMLSVSLLPMVHADQEAYEPSEEEMQELERQRDEAIAAFFDDFNAESTLDADLAATKLVDLAMGAELTDEDKLELAKFLRDAEAGGLDSPMTETFAEEAVMGYLSANGIEIARDIVADEDGFDALLERDAFAGKTLEETMMLLAPLGIDEDGVERNRDVLQAFRGASDTVPTLNMGPWGQEYWDTLGVTATLVQLTVALVSPVGGSNFLPHNINLNFAYIAARLTSGVEGDFWRGYAWAQLDVDDFLGVSFDIRQNTDTLALQLPLSVRAEVHWRVSCGWLGCSISIWIEIHFPQTIIATNPVWEFAVPAQTGTFSSRAESSDILMVVYDRLGTLHTQKAREDTSAPPSLPVNPAGPLPGLGDLGTQSPIVNYYGLQGDFSSVPNAPTPPALPADVPDVRERQRGSFANPGDSLGHTAGYTADRTQAWHLNIFAVRLSTAGTGSTGALGEPPASFYYEAPSNIMTGGGMMYQKDWDARNDVSL